MRPRFLLTIPFLLSVLACSGAKDKPNSVTDVTKQGSYDWPQWQGVNRNAISPEKGLLQEWPKEGPKLAWKAEKLGQTYSTPTVANGRIFVMGNRDKKEYVIALAEKDGTELWATEVGAVRSNGGGYPGPRCSPTVDGSLVYALGLNGDLLCLSVDKGEISWRKDFRKDFKGSGGGWGYCESPLIDGDRLICTPGGKTSTLVALNKKTGEVIWTGVVPEGDSAAYSSIISGQVDGKKQYIQFLSKGVVGLSEDGKFLWRYNAPANGTANISTPICHENHVFAATGYGTGGGLAKLEKNGDAYEAKQVYFTKNMKNQHGGLLLIDGFVYGSNEGELVCLDYKTGEVQWRDRQPGKGSISAADGRIYYRSEGGPMYLVEINPKKYVKCGEFKPARSGSPSWPHPVIANGKLYLQDQDFLLCYDVKQ